MTAIRITKIRLSKNDGGHEHITHVATNIGVNLIPISDVVFLIDEMKDEFFVIDPISGNKVSVHVVNNKAVGHPYIQTKSDGILSDNLLSLPHTA